MKQILLASLFFVFAASARADLIPPVTGITVNSSSGTIATFYASTATITNFVGTVTNDNAPTGDFGEYLSSATTVANSFTTSNQFSDCTSISLTAGDWNVSGNLFATANSATVGEVDIGISATAGNNAAGLVNPQNRITGLGPTAVADTVTSLPLVRVSIASTTVYYLKALAQYSVATPQYRCFLQARRVR